MRRQILSLTIQTNLGFCSQLINKFNTTAQIDLLNSNMYNYKIIVAWDFFDFHFENQQNDVQTNDLKSQTIVQICMQIIVIFQKQNSNLIPYLQRINVNKQLISVMRIQQLEKRDTHRSNL